MVLNLSLNLGSKELKNSFSIIAFISYSSIWLFRLGSILWSNILGGIPKALGSNFLSKSKGASYPKKSELIFYLRTMRYRESKRLSVVMFRNTKSRYAFHSYLLINCVNGLFLSCKAWSRSHPANCLTSPKSLIKFLAKLRYFRFVKSVNTISPCDILFPTKSIRYKF